MFDILINAFKTGDGFNKWQAQLESTDQDALAISAIVLGLAPLLEWRLRQQNVLLEPRAMAKLAAARETARAQWKDLAAQLDAILSVLAVRGICPILLKGNYLAAFVYPEPYLRQMNDIDMLVKPQDLEATTQALTGLGYVGTFKSAERGAGVRKHTVTFRPPRADDPTPNPYLSAAPGRTVEPHTSLEESWYGLCADITPGVWERSAEILVNGRTARALASDDLVLHLGTHLIFHLIMGYPSMVQLMDLRFVVERLGERIRWDEVAERAIARHVAPFVYAALRIAEKNLDVPVPLTVLERLAGACSPQVRRYAETLTLADMVTRTQRAPVTTFEQRLRRGWQDRAEVARWTSSMRDQWQVWKTLLNVPATDTGALIMERVRGGLHPRAKNTLS